MRPLELRVRNFRSYFGPEAVFDFRGRRLVGIVGPIGSGKSSILDAISFALYGKTPSIAGATRALIHQRAEDGAVALRFEVEGEVWEAVRNLRRKGAGQHALYRYARDTDEDPVETITLEGDVNDRVARLLGLDFDAFRRSVLLAQGRFAEFLRSRPAERDKVLKGLFGHERLDRMREMAKERAAAADVEAARFDAVLERIDRLGAEVDALASELTEVESRLASLVDAAPRDVELRRQKESSTEGARAAEARLAELTERLSMLPDRGRVEAVSAEIEAARKARARVARMLEQARVRTEEAERTLEAAREKGLPGLIDEGSRLLAASTPLRERDGDARARRARVSDRLDASRRRLSDASAEVTKGRQGLADAEVAAEVAGRRLKEAAASLHEAEHGNMVAALRSDLELGHACPVCEQTVAVLPTGGASEELDGARRAVEGAEEGRERADAARAAAGESLATARQAEKAAEEMVVALEAELAACDVEVETAAKEVAEVAANLRELLGEGDPAELLAGLRTDLGSLESATADARTLFDRARAEHDEVIRREQESERTLGALHVELTDAAARAGIAGPASSDDAAILETFDRLRNAMIEAGDAARSAAGEAAAGLEEAERLLTELHDGLGIDGDLPSELGSQRARAELLGRQHAQKKAELNEGKDAAGRRDAALARRTVYRRIASDLTDARFVRYLLDEERTRLGRLGGDHFMRLSAGRYSFVDDGNFGIRDQTAADAERKSDSLSGGETFLASLALALALAEMVSRSGGRLDSFFLDEGFGSLDPEHLDLAMDGIEALVAGESGRLVVVVSHVPEMRERIEDLIELSRDPMTGDTRVRSGASLRPAAASPPAEQR